MSKLIGVLFLSTLATMSLSGASIIFGVNDTNQDGDHADMVFKVTGNFKLVAGCDASQPTCNTGGTWLPMQIPDANLNPFWDGFSLDGPGMNIGNFILGTGGFTGNPASPNWSLAGTQYFGVLGGGPGGFYLAPEGAGGSATAELLIEVAGLSNQNTLSYALMSSPTTYTTMFSGPTSAGATYSLSITDPLRFGFSIGTGPTVTSDGTMQIAAFQQPQQGTVPEPITFVLMGAGLVGIAALRRRHKPS